MNINTITTIIATIMLIITMVILTTFIWELITIHRDIIKIIEKKILNDKYIIKHKYTIKESRELLDQLIDNKLIEWQIYNTDTTSDNYMDETKMKDCIIYIIKQIILEMTDIQKDILSVGYPMNTTNEMIESIKNKATLAVLNYSIKQNTPSDNPGIDIIKNMKKY